MGKIREALGIVADLKAPPITQADLNEGEKITRAPYNPSIITEAAVQIFKEDGVNRTQEAFIRDVAGFVFWALQRGEQERLPAQDLMIFFEQLTTE